MVWRVANMSATSVVLVEFGERRDKRTDGQTDRAAAADRRPQLLRGIS